MRFSPAMCSLCIPTSVLREVDLILCILGQRRDSCLETLMRTCDGDPLQAKTLWFPFFKSLLYIPILLLYHSLHICTINIHIHLLYSTYCLQCWVTIWFIGEINIMFQQKVVKIKQKHSNKFFLVNELHQIFHWKSALVAASSTLLLLYVSLVIRTAGMTITVAPTEL